MCALAHTHTHTHTHIHTHTHTRMKNIYTLICRQTGRPADRLKKPILITVLTAFSAIDVLARLAFKDVCCIFHTLKINLVLFLITENKNSNQSAYFFSKEQITVYRW